MDEPSNRPTRFAAILLAVFLVIAGLAPIGAPANGTDLALHQIPTLVCLVWLVVYFRRHPFDRLSYTLIFLFLVVHTIGARYLYSDVPYDAWCESLLGFRPTERFDLARNHYDRFVHFVFGLWIYRPMRQVIAQYARCSFRASVLLALCGIVTIGAGYEIIEWLIAVTLSPETADRYNGQQGDIWDAQKDQALAILGAAIAASPALLRYWSARTS